MSAYKKINLIFQRIQNLVERSLPSFEADQTVLQQSRFLIRALTWTLLITTCGGISWLALAKTDEIIRVEGKLEPIGDVKEVQIPVGSVIKEILVNSGDQVTKGEILIVLDNEIANQNINSLQNQLVQKNKQLELKKIEKLKNSELIEAKMDLLQKRYSLEKDITNRFLSLAEKGAISEMLYLQQLEKSTETLGKIIEEEKEAELHQVLLDQQLTSINLEISQLKAKNTEANVLLKYKSVRTPVDGLVFDIKPKSIGLVAQSNEPILKIVPFNKLEADVLIPSNKIGFVRVGMPAEISIDSFPASEFGPLKGEVFSIGSDVLPVNSIGGNIKYLYPGVIRLKQQQLILKDKTTLPLQVGMTLNANIKLRKLTYLQLLLSNFKDKSQSLKQL